MAHAAPDVPKDKYPELGERYRHHYVKHKDDISLFDGVLPLLGALRERQHWLAVATGKSRRGLDRVFRETDSGQWFDASRTADETRSKPHPQMLLELLAELNTPVERAVMVGDTEYDLEMARAISGFYRRGFA